MKQVGQSTSFLRICCFGVTGDMKRWVKISYRIHIEIIFELVLSNILSKQLSLIHLTFVLFLNCSQLRDYGYESSTGTNGNIPSGSYGSGIVPVTLSLMIGMTLIWIFKLIIFVGTKS